MAPVLELIQLIVILELIQLTSGSNVVQFWFRSSDSVQQQLQQQVCVEMRDDDDQVTGQQSRTVVIVGQVTGSSEGYK